MMKSTKTTKPGWLILFLYIFAFAGPASATLPELGFVKPADEASTLRLERTAAPASPGDFSLVLVDRASLGLPEYQRLNPGTLLWDAEALSYKLWFYAMPNAWNIGETLFLYVEASTLAGLVRATPEIQFRCDYPTHSANVCHSPRVAKIANDHYVMFFNRYHASGHWENWVHSMTSTNGHHWEKEQVVRNPPGWAADEVLAGFVPKANNGGFAVYTVYQTGDHRPFHLTRLDVAPDAHTVEAVAEVSAADYRSGGDAIVHEDGLLHRVIVPTANRTNLCEFELDDLGNLQNQACDLVSRPDELAPFTLYFGAFSDPRDAVPMDCPEFIEVPVAENVCGWTVEPEALSDIADTLGDNVTCAMKRPAADDLHVVERTIQCDDGQTLWACTTLVVPHDSTPATIEVLDNTVTYAIEPGGSVFWTPITDIFDVTFEDNCTPSNAVQWGIMDIQSSDPAEDIDGAPGAFRLDGLWADWHQVAFTLDSAREYVITVGTLDAAGLYSETTLTLRFEAES